MNGNYTTCLSLLRGASPLQASVRRHLLLQDGPLPPPLVPSLSEPWAGTSVSLPTELEQLTSALLPCTRPLIPKLTHIMVDLQLLEDEGLRLRVQGGGAGRPAGHLRPSGRIALMGEGSGAPWSRGPALETSNCLPRLSLSPQAASHLGKKVRWRRWSGSGRTLQRDRGVKGQG